MPRTRKKALPRYVSAVSQRDGTVRYRSWFPLGADGRKKWTRVFDTPEDALAARLEAMKLREEMPATLVTLGDALAATRAELELNNRPGTLRWFDGHKAVLESELGAATALQQLTPARLERFRDDMLARVSAATVGHYRRALSLVVRRAMRRGDLNANPLHRIKWPRVETKEAPHVPQETAAEIIERMREAGGERDADLVQLLFLSGLRRSELVRLTVEDVDMRRRKLWIRGKTANEHVEIAPDAVDAVKRLRAQADEDGRLVPVREDQVSRLFARWKARLKLTCAFTPHVCRHSFITWLVDAGNPIEVVQRLARHKTLAMTMRYFHGHVDGQQILAGLNLSGGSVRKLRAVE